MGSPTPSVSIYMFKKPGWLFLLVFRCIKIYSANFPQNPLSKKQSPIVY